MPRPMGPPALVPVEGDGGGPNAIWLAGKGGRSKLSSDSRFHQRLVDSFYDAALSGADAPSPKTPGDDVCARTAERARG